MKWNMITRLSVLLCAACLIVACDDGRIYEEVTSVQREGGSIRLTGHVTGRDTWASGYSIVLAGFADGNEYAQTAKGLTTVNGDSVDVVLSGIPSEVTQIEICAINRLRKRLFTFYASDYTEQEDTLRIDVGSLDIGMYTTVQTNLFDRTCTSCHGGSTSAARGLYLTADSSYKALVNVPADLSPEGMPFVTPGDVEQSFLHYVLNSDVSADWGMDHSDMVTSSDLLNLVDDWIANGAKE